MIENLLFRYYVGIACLHWHMPSFGVSDFFPNAKQIVESCLPLSILGGRTFSNELFEERPLYV